MIQLMFASVLFLDLIHCILLFSPLFRDHYVTLFLAFSAKKSALFPSIKPQASWAFPSGKSISLLLEFKQQGLSLHSFHHISSVPPSITPKAGYLTWH